MDEGNMRSATSAPGGSEITTNSSSDEDNAQTLPTPDEQGPTVLPELSGFLEKMSPAMFVGWQKRYFKLQNKKLAYYKRDTDIHPKGVISFDNSSVEVKVITKITPHELHIIPLAGKRTFRLRAKTEEELNTWTELLQMHISESKGYAQRMTTVAVQKNFWRYDRISEYEFSHNIATTCDILLFRGKGLSAKVQRAVTRSEFDHVAMMLRYSSGKLAFLEATAMEGVTIIEWDEFLFYKWHLLYSRLVFRKVEMQRGDQLLQQLEDFIGEVRGKKYKISASKLLRRATNKRPGSEEGFFCSELIASAYKHIGLLPSDVPSSNYLPGDFSRERDLRLLNGARFEVDYLIDFSLD